MPAHHESSFVPYSPRRMFDLVADVERYPEFLPWCRAARVSPLGPGLLRAEMVIGFKGITERYSSRVSLNPGEGLIEVAHERGPFRHLRNSWMFEEAPGGCRVVFDLDFEFSSRLLGLLITPVFGEAVRRMSAAFLRRADMLYGGQQEGGEASLQNPARR